MSTSPSGQITPLGTGRLMTTMRCAKGGSVAAVRDRLNQYSSATNAGPDAVLKVTAMGWAFLFVFALVLHMFVVAALMAIATIIVVIAVCDRSTEALVQNSTLRRRTNRNSGPRVRASGSMR